MIIHGRSGLPADVNADYMLETKSVSESLLAQASRVNARAFSVVAIDAGPVAAEYPLYVQNNNTTLKFVVTDIWTSNVDADVIWKLHHVTGTAAGASVITPVNLNLVSTYSAPATCRGGAGGVTGLSSSNVLHTWYGGNVYDAKHINLGGSLILGEDDAIALEYDAGTGGACAAVIQGYYK